MDAVVANDLARLHRKGWRIGALVDRIQTNSVRLLLAAPGRQIDLSTPQGQWLVLFLAMADEYYVTDARLRQQDNARRRREKGVTTGNPPAGTCRGEGGFLERTRRGAWYLPDASFVCGVPEMCPSDGAVWRGYAECTLKILTLYATSSLGYESIAYRLQQEGWPFEDRRDVPRPITGDDVRRVVSNWPEYGGLIGGRCAKDRTAEDLARIRNMDFVDERAVFPVDILRGVALKQQHNKVAYQATNHGVTNEAYSYPLRNLLRCAGCEKHALQRSDPRLRSTLGGTDQNGVKRYRHKGGVQCSCQARSVRCEIVEDDFVQLLRLLKPRAGIFGQLLKIAAQVSRQLKFKRVDFAQQRRQALQRLERQIAALHRQYRDGILSEADYNQQLAQRKGEQDDLIAREIPLNAPPFDLAACVSMLDALAVLWTASSPDYRQALSQNLFDYLVYDIDRQRILDYALSPWVFMVGHF